MANDNKLGGLGTEPGSVAEKPSEFSEEVRKSLDIDDIEMTPSEAAAWLAEVEAEAADRTFIAEIQLEVGEELNDCGMPEWDDDLEPVLKYVTVSGESSFAEGAEHACRAQILQEYPALYEESKTLKADIKRRFRDLLLPAFVKDEQLPKEIPNGYRLLVVNRFSTRDGELYDCRFFAIKKGGKDNFVHDGETVSADAMDESSEDSSLVYGYDDNKSPAYSFKFPVDTMEFVAEKYADGELVEGHWIQNEHVEVK